MAFRDFDFPDVVATLGLRPTEVDFVSGLPPAPPPPGLAERLAADVPWAVNTGTEKARSEFIIAPVLAELRRSNPGRFGLFSGVELNVDPARGLSGYCDFILTRSPLQSILAAPLVAVAEAKNDNVRYGLGQCIAGMVAVREFNQRAGTVQPTIYGVVTTGTAWKFLKLVGDDLTLDSREYFITELPRIFGILTYIITVA